jgi:outer membrane protein
MDSAIRMFSSLTCLLTGTSSILFLIAVFVLSPAPVTAITLNECIEAALTMNPGLEAASYRIKVSRSAHLQARSAWYPLISVSGSHTQTNNPSQAFMMELNRKTLDMTDPGFDPADPGHTYNTRFSIGMQYLLYDGGSSRLHEEMAEQGIDLSRYRHAAAKNELVYEVTRGYYNTLKAGEFVSVFRETAASIEKSLQLAKKRFAEGTALKTDVLNLEVQLAQAQEDLISAENGFLMAIAALNTSIGADIVSADTLVPPADEKEAFHAPVLAEKTVDQRPELQAAALIVKLKKTGLKRSRRAYHPSIKAFGSIDMDGRVSDSFEDSYIAGVIATWNVFDGYARSGAVSESRALRNEAVAHLKQTRKQLELDLTDAKLRISNAVKRLDVTRKALDNSEELLQMTRTQYENGAVEITALLNAHSALTASTVRNKAAHYDYLDSLANMNRATGQPWP